MDDFFLFRAEGMCLTSTQWRTFSWHSSSAAIGRKLSSRYVLTGAVPRIREGVACFGAGFVGKAVLIF